MSRDTSVDAAKTRPNLHFVFYRFEGRILCNTYLNTQFQRHQHRTVSGTKTSWLLEVHGSMHHNTNLIEMTNKMQLCRTTYYSIVP